MQRGTAKKDSAGDSMKKELKIAIAIFVNAFVLGLNITGIMPVLSMVSERYAGISTGMIQLLQTLPYALLMVGSFVVGNLTMRFSKKKIVLAGLIIVGFRLLSQNFSHPKNGGASWDSMWSAWGSERCSAI